MELSTAAIFALIEARRIELGLSQAEVGRRAFNQNDGSALQNMKRGSAPTIENLGKLCASLGLDVQIGPKTAAAPVEHVMVDGADFARIPLHDAYLSAGPGVTNGDVAIIDHLVFRNEWLQKIGLKPDHAAMARISGDSMAPGIQHGDLVLIDTSKREVPVAKKCKNPVAPPIFAFMQDDEARVKRLERQEPSALILYSDNQTFRPEILFGSEVDCINILGQVVWSGHVWR
jgi:phage repressor protein C with HTH and peptisase S24 domain